MRADRKIDPQNGVEEIIAPTMNTSVYGLLSNLVNAETEGHDSYELVDAFYKLRRKKDGSPYHMVRFVFCRKEFVRLDNTELASERSFILDGLIELCRTALWRVRASLNPFYENGEPIPGQIAISVNLEVRTPLFEPDGKPAVKWQKDAAGNRIGSAPVPLAPDYELRANNGAIQLVPVN